MKIDLSNQYPDRKMNKEGKNIQQGESAGIDVRCTKEIDELGQRLLYSLRIDCFKTYFPEFAPFWTPTENSGLSEFEHAFEEMWNRAKREAPTKLVQYIASGQKPEINEQNYTLIMRFAFIVATEMYQDQEEDEFIRRIIRMAEIMFGHLTKNTIELMTVSIALVIKQRKRETFVDNLATVMAMSMMFGRL